MHLKKKLVVIGGGAAGFFAAITAAESNPELQVIILEQGNEVLGKVRISGGGRCNVTHACFDVKELVKYYPRGHKELMSAFYEFNCEHTIEWFENKGVKLKTEADGRIFPISDSSQSIIDCLITQCKLLNIQIIKQAKVLSVEKNKLFSVYYNTHQISADFVLMASGSNQTIWNMLNKLGHTIIQPVPSLFTFNIKHELINKLEGITLKNVQCTLVGSKITMNGNMLITHTGLSGPSILKLSAFAAREIFALNYQFEIEINWISYNFNETIEIIKTEKQHQSKRQAGNFSLFDLPHRFWLNVLWMNGIGTDKLVADLSNNEVQHIAQTLCRSILKVNSKNTNKEEFVTAGGIALKEVDFKTMESKIIPDLFFAGEVLNIDAVTGGFNFQAAWTTGYLAGKAIGFRN